MGIVERFGPKQISGWVEWNDPAKREVDIKVNGLTVAQTVACRPVRLSGAISEFGFARHLKDLWNYIGSGDAVTVEHAGVKIAISGHGFNYRPPADTPSNFEALAARIAEGHVFDKRGHLAPAFNLRDNRRAFNAFAKIRQAMKAEFGYELFVFYGTLLGCIREGDFISHDNDIDFAYISRHHTRDAVVSEFQQMCAFLIDLGYQGVLYRHGFGIKSPTALDIYYTWFDPHGHFQASFGYHGDTVPFDAAFHEFEERSLGRFKVQVPKSSEKILTQLYGPTWRIPNPGFSHYSRNRKIPQEYLQSLEELSPLYWRQFYRRPHRATGAASSLAEYAATRLAGAQRVIVDLGCGDGADALYLAKAGHQVFGVDASPEAIGLIAENYVNRPEIARCQFDSLDITDEEKLSDYLSKARIATAATNEAVVIYTRNLIELLSPNALRELVRLLRLYCESYELIMEFRTGEGRPPPTTTAQHYIRPAPPQEVVNELIASGLKIVESSALQVGGEPIQRVVATSKSLGTHAE